MFGSYSINKLDEGKRPLFCRGAAAANLSLSEVTSVLKHLHDLKLTISKKIYWALWDHLGRPRDSSSRLNQ